MLSRRIAYVFLFICCAGISFAETPNPLPWANPWDVGLDYEYVNAAFSDLAGEVENKSGPGGVGMIIKDGKIVARRAVGNMQTQMMSRGSDGDIVYTPAQQPMMEMTIFDMASVTKAVACTTSIMLLVERGQLDLDATVASYIPTFGARAKDQVTVRQLITHTSGLPAWFPFYTLFIDRQDVYRQIDEALSLSYKPGDKRIYSDLGFIMLGRIVEVISDERLDVFTRDNIFEPLGMEDTMYLPDLQHRLRTAPTEYDLMRDKELKGIVHDENTRAMGGVSGHAGLYSTVNDLAIFAQMLLNKGEFNSVRIFKEETIDLMLKRQIAEGPRKKGSGFLQSREQLIGWWGMDDKLTLHGGGGLPSTSAFGHQGFTGTMIWVDPEHNCAAILLTNAVHPKRAEASKPSLFRAFYINVSKALVGEKVNILEP
ncbi:MAG: serine hydrolase [Candidatus Hinthialibacter antarcticus]|nr:serine hydrolase [Candidatus Hinthialibacter antarcticus]